MVGSLKTAIKGLSALGCDPDRGIGVHDDLAAQLVRSCVLSLVLPSALLHAKEPHAVIGVAPNDVVRPILRRVGHDQDLHEVTRIVQSEEALDQLLDLSFFRCRPGRRKRCSATPLASSGSGMDLGDADPMIRNRSGIAEVGVGDQDKTRPRGRTERS